MRLLWLQLMARNRLAGQSLIPNELLYKIVLERVMDDIHSICMPINSFKPSWKRFLAILHVSRIFRLTTLHILSTALKIRLNSRGNLPMDFILKSLDHLWRLSPIHAPSLSMLDIEIMSMELDGTLHGILYIYRSAAICTAMWRQMSTSGWANRLSKRESCWVIRRLRSMTIKAAILCDEIRPRELTTLVSEVVIMHCVTPYLKCAYWHIANTLDHYLKMEDLFDSPSSVKV
ncbi:hypothetical protein BU17DRAFT_62762 [Hysterangium stoloniferum]|nr:hypothetical protein BU17DRAFT_62762 [Hysterangium stoloniferum]